MSSSDEEESSGGNILESLGIDGTRFVNVDVMIEFVFSPYIFMFVLIVLINKIAFSACPMDNNKMMLVLGIIYVIFVLSIYVPEGINIPRSTAGVKKEEEEEDEEAAKESMRNKYGTRKIEVY